MQEFLINITPREYQQKIFETCKEKNCLVVLPTGIGKTLIGLMLAIERLEKFPSEKIVFLAPTRPLAEQHLAYFKKHLPELFADMNLFTGSIPPEKRKKLWETSNIVFSTPQCVANDLKNYLYNLNEVCLLIEDEAHRCIKNYDYNYVAQKYLEQGKNKRIIGLTASPGSELDKIKEICKNLSIEEVELRTRDSADVKEYLQELEFEKINVNFPEELAELRHSLRKIFDNYVEELRKRSVLFGAASKTELINLQKRLMSSISRDSTNFNSLLAASACAQAVKLQHALELLETQTLASFNNYLKDLFAQAAKKQSKGVVKLVSKPEFNDVFIKTNELLARNIEHPKLGILRNIVEAEKDENPNLKIIVFTQYRETASSISKKLNEIKGIRAKIFVGQAKKTSAGGSSGLNQKEQKKVIQEFSEGEINVLCATSIGEEGLDIPEVNIVIFYEPIPSAIRAIQRAGRTARLMEGKLIILITKGTRDESFYYASRAREKRMHLAIKEIKDNFARDEIKKEEKQKMLR
ncbi:MAG: DEAD/DEAH box helicase [Nanoarchaeota archaeon]